MKLIALFSAIILFCGCKSSVTDGDRSPQFLSAVDVPEVPKDKPMSSRLTAKQAIKIASDLAKERHAQLENYSPPRATFFPKNQHWWVQFPNKQPYTYGKPETYEHIAVSIDDGTGDAAFNEQTPALKKAIGENSRAASGLTNALVATQPDEGQYRKAALKLLVQEANQVAKELNLPEMSPITETNLARSFILPFAGAQSWKAVGTISTRDYSYCVSKSNQFCFLERLHREEDMSRWQTEYFWPISRMDTKAAYQIATQWLSAVSMNVEGLNRDCWLHIQTPIERIGFRRWFVPLYSVYWEVKGREGQGSAASVQVFLPTKTLVQLRVDDPEYNLRTPLAMTKVESVRSQTNAAYDPSVRGTNKVHRFR